MRMNRLHSRNPGDVVRARPLPSILAAFAVGLALCGLLAASGAVPAGAAGPARAPAFRVKSLSGETLALDSLRARGPVVLDFWAMWCKPCVAAIPEMEALWRKHRERGLTVIGVSEDGPRDGGKVRAFAARQGMSYPIVLDADLGLQERFKIRAMPTTVLIDREGRVARFAQGYRPGETAALDSALVRLLDPAPSTTEPAAPADTSGRGR
jgi:peroxiredoxin